jgi:ACS family sodium-dependent inorganic phosphate cotransporter/ACS family sodium-dependent inorganic phosphate cotransporter-like MFS transporter 9
VIIVLLQGLIQSAFLWGYTATQLLGGHLADKFGGRAVIGFGVAWFSIASLLLPAALSPAVAAAGMTLPAVLLARMCVVSGVGVGQMCAVIYCRLIELS